MLANYITMKKRIIHFCLLMAGVVTLLISCTAEDYDLENVNSEVTLFASGLAFPLGTTGKLGVETVIDADSSTTLFKDEKGGYYLKFGGSASLNDYMPDFSDLVKNSDFLNLDDLLYEMSNIYNKSQVVLPPSVGDGDYEIPAGILPEKSIDTQEYEVDIKFEMPDHVKSIKDVKLSPDAKVKCSLSIDDPIISKGSIIPAIDVDLSDFLIVEGSDEPIHLSELVLSEKNGYSASHTYAITGLNIAPSDFEKVEQGIKKNVTISGKVSVSNCVTNKATLEASENMKLTLVVSYIDIDVKRIEGIFDYDIQDITKYVTLDSIPDLFRKEGVCFDLTNPSLNINMTSNLGIPMYGNMNIEPYKVGADISFAVVDKSFELPYSTDSGKSATSSLTIEGDEMGNLIKFVPDRLDFRVSAQIDETKTSIIDLDAEYFMDMEHEIIIPLSFGEDFIISLSDTIDVTDVNLNQLLENGGLKLYAEVNNAMPLQFDMTLELLDFSGQAVDVDPIVCKIAPGGKDGAAQVSNVEMFMVVNENSSIPQVGNIKISFDLSSGSAADIPITDKSYIEAKLAVELPEGITISSEEE